MGVGVGGEEGGESAGSILLLLLDTNGEGRRVLLRGKTVRGGFKVKLYAANYYCRPVGASNNLLLAAQPPGPTDEVRR